VATSSRLGRYLGSVKNLTGCVGGLVGLGLHFAGVAGAYWPLVVAGTYAAGALAAPPEKVSLVVDDTAAETGRLRADLDRLIARVRSRRTPAEALDRLEEIAATLRDLLGRTDLLSADSRYEIARAIRTDLPIGFETYLNLPRWYAARHGEEASAELVAQLGLIAASVARTADEAYAAETRRMRDHTRYLRDRERTGDLTLPDGPEPPAAP
jgi:hypothetical protein